ncbi:KAP family P-loop domain [Serratia quinivorans]|uniref:P-loop NTPase fold protein n=1 Tax=Serratia quinivorans TaxID=137545 RepID=UPI000F6B3D1C|nr:P-loop NTPase fold protein [Serratia quinivorans]VEI68115.1 KAP family P-loop domain [Serratia quinivorans]
MENINQHIEDYIENYYKLTKEPGYAILLKGKWGTGKTWFIKRTLSKYKDHVKNKDKYLYISLYGMTNFDDIDNEFFKQLHPVLSSKTMDVVGKVAKGLLRTSLKIDLDGHNSVNVSPQMPNFELPDFLKDTSEFLIVFDDLERSSIPLESIMGYINHFVEQQGRKVIIIANEDEIFDADENTKTKETKNEQSASGGDTKTTAYRRIKEKLIGKTFEVKPNFDDALNNFIKEIGSNAVSKYLSKNLSVISDTYHESEYKNLRHLKQALWDFEILLPHLNQSFLKNNKLLNHLLKLFLILSFEIKSGNLNVKDIPDFAHLQILTYKAQSDNEISESVIYKISQRYTSEVLNDFIFKHSTWVEILDSSIFNAMDINDAIKESQYIRTSEAPRWLVLWNARHITQEKLDETLLLIKEDINSRSIKEVGIILHLVGIYLWLSDENIVENTKQEIVDAACNYIDYMAEEGLLTKDSLEDDQYRETESWGGHGFFEKDTEEFKTVSDYIVEKTDNALISEYPIRAEKLVNLMKTDAHQFFRTVIFNNNSDNKYYDLPIFSYITPKSFVDAIMDTPVNMRKYIGWTFSSRYKAPFGRQLFDEVVFLQEVIAILQKIRQSNQGKLLGFQLGELIDYGFTRGLEHLVASNPSSEDKC